MFKMTILKIKKLCGVALIPRILRDEVTLSPRKLGKRPLDGYWKMAKSTDSKDREAECEKCKKLIEMVFGREKPDPLLKQVETNIEDIQIDKIQKAIAPNVNLNEKPIDSNDLQPIENAEKDLESPEITYSEKVDASKIENPIEQNVLPINDILQSTTAKATEEQLAQKLETIEEPGLVEAETPKTVGFNNPPKVLGGQEEILGSKNSLCMKIGPEEDAMDEIAKKCLGTPPDKIDERILDEMKSCGMLGRGQKKTSRKSGYHAMKCNKKDTLLETKSEQTSLHYENKEKINTSLYSYPSTQYNMKFAHNAQNIYHDYFKNAPLALIGDGKFCKETNGNKIIPTEQKTKKTALKEANTTIRDEKPSLVSFDYATTVESEKFKSLRIDQACSKADIPEDLTGSITAEKEQPKEITENVEEEVEEIRVTAAETSRLGIPGESEIDPDFDYKKTKTEILPCTENLQVCEATVEEKVIAPNQHEHIVFANSKHPKDFHFRPDLPERPFINPNTAISSTFPIIDQRHDAEPTKYDTSISAKQNPDEYFDLSHCRIEIVKDPITTLSEIRPLPAFHQYTIISKTHEVLDAEQLLFSQKLTPDITSSQASELKLDPHIEHEELSNAIKKDISAAIGTLPQLKDMEKKLSMTELLRKVRERNRLQYCRECAFKALEVEPVEANKGKCPPPLDKGPGKTLGPGQTLGPGPCKPKPKPACPPPPSQPASPCKPKDPCAKFSRTSILGDKIREAFTLVLQVAFKPAIAITSLSFKSKSTSVDPSNVTNDEDTKKAKLGSFLLSNCPESKKSENEDVILARDYEPWSPIPSWPMPKTEKKAPFVCPKEGCKLIPPPRLSEPCKENPCANLPKRTFSTIDFDLVEFEPLYLYDEEF